MNKFRSLVIFILTVAIFLLISCSEVIEGLGFFNSGSFEFFNEKTPINSIEKKFIDNYLQDVQELDTSIKVKLAYATCNNFTGINLYGTFNKCYLPKSTAQKLVLAQKKLKSSRPDLSLLILDATRPRSIQQIMWDTCNYPLNIKSKYLAKPTYTSMHNYGAAIDLTIIDGEGMELDMGTPFDFFGPLAEPRMESYYLSQGKLTNLQLENRKLLRKVMTEAGFNPIPNEWWHFDAGTRNWVKQNLKLIE
ncbi:MAG: M15 family metallopeptidase [Bacteroidota bacterium]|jgi:D-alanyl-D-alanine dipeptidase